MAEDSENLKSLFLEAEMLRAHSESGVFSIDASPQETLRAAILKYEQCSKISEEVSLFSSNEDAEDIASSDLQSVQLTVASFL